MTINVSIRVVNAEGDPIPFLTIYATEAIYFTDQADECETDDEGYGELSFNAFGNEMTLEIYIENQPQGKFRVKDGKTLSFTYDD